MIFKLINKEENLHPELWKIRFIYKDEVEGKPITGKVLNYMKTHVTFMDREAFEGNTNELALIHTEKDGGFQKVMLVGLGKKTEFDMDLLRDVMATATRELIKRKITKAIFEMTSLPLDEISIREMGTTIVLAKYKFDKYKSSSKQKLEEVYFEVEEESRIGLSSYLEEGVHLGNATVLARNLTNEPANILTPDLLSKRALNVGEKIGFEVEVFNQKDIEKLKMEAYLEVAKGSQLPPKLIVMRYRGNPDSNIQIGLVGKGLTYDTGGLSLKPAKSMTIMRCDMGGAAAVLGAMMAIGKMKLKANVVAVIAACENAISANAYRPGDIISSMAGKQIYIENTDAEGRLTLIDALHYVIEEEKVDYVIDIATLTAAAVQSLGTVATVSMSNDDDYYKVFQKAAKSVGEKEWRMPMYKEYRKKLKHPYADLTNLPGTPGAITAGLFLHEFVQDKPWIHLDIAGTSWVEKPSSYFSKGATGVGVRSLYALVKEMEEVFK